MFPRPDKVLFCFHHFLLTAREDVFTTVQGGRVCGQDYAPKSFETGAAGAT